MHNLRHVCTTEHHVATRTDDPQVRAPVCNTKWKTSDSKGRMLYLKNR